MLGAFVYRTKPEEPPLQHVLPQGSSQAVREGRLPDPTNNDHISYAAWKRMRKKENAAKAKIQAELKLPFVDELAPDESASASVYETSSDFHNPFRCVVFAVLDVKC